MLVGNIYFLVGCCGGALSRRAGRSHRLYQVKESVCGGGGWVSPSFAGVILALLSFGKPSTHVLTHCR